MSPAAGGWVRAVAPAKVNLRLEVLGRRPDGYHELETLMLALELADEVAARASSEPGLRLSLSGAQAGADVPDGPANLAWRAAAAVLERLAGTDPERRGLELRLEKRVPSQAGLGGASADAAGALLAAEAALGAVLTPAARQELLAGLGSDCAFFAAPGGLAWCRGRGELVEPLPGPAPSWWLALVTPSVLCPTERVYRALSTPLSRSGIAPSLHESFLSQPALGARAELFNRLEEAALRAIPDLRAWKDALSSCGAGHFRLSGSGSTFFGLFDERGEAERALGDVRAELQRRGLGARWLGTSRPAGRGAHLLGDR